MKRRKYLIALLALFAFPLFSQSFDMSLEVRPRYENRHGFKTLINNNDKAANFISQRSRIYMKYGRENLKLNFSMQNIRVWGDASSVANDDISTSIHEAWAEAILSNKISIKLGRQEISYDNQRIMGSAGWAQQSRRHDAFLFKLKPNQDHKLDIGLAYNADNQGLIEELYSNAAGYKTFQYAWYHGTFNDFGLSFLALNNGVEFLNNQNEPTTNYTFTVGPHLTYKSQKIYGHFATYLQNGKLNNLDVNSFYLGMDLGFNFDEEMALESGFQYLSGKDMNDGEETIKSFVPLHGTNHRYNGWMDYFFVGNHVGSVGLIDVFASLNYNKGKYSAKLIPHIFNAAADMYEGSNKIEKYLGTEIDFTFGYKIDDDINLNLGFSKMFASDSMEVLKGGNKDNNNSWGWIMFTFKPDVFSYVKKSKT